MSQQMQIQWLAGYQVYKSSGELSGCRTVRFSTPDNLYQYDEKVWELAAKAAAALDEVSVCRVHVNEVDAL